jgi:hypothetical protein
VNRRPSGTAIALLVLPVAVLDFDHRYCKGPPIRYEALDRCLTALGDKALELDASVHLPRIGCGLAGGRWDRVEPLIGERLCGRGVSVTVYDVG